MTTLQLYNYTGHPNTIQKSLGEAVEVQGLHYDRISTDRCEVQLQDIDGTFNYAYITELAKYYFIDSSRIEQTGVTRLYMTLDPLMTYKDLILSATATATQSSEFNNMDNSLQGSYDISPEIEVTPFDYTFDKKGTTVMITLKGN